MEMPDIEELARKEVAAWWLKSEERRSGCGDVFISQSRLAYMAIPDMIVEICSWQECD